MAILKIVNVDVTLFIVVNIKLRPIGRKGEPIGLFEFFSKQLHLAIGGKTVDTLKWDFLFFTLRQVRGWVGEVGRAIRAKHHIVGAVKTLALVPVGEYFVGFAVGREANYSAKDAG